MKKSFFKRSRKLMSLFSLFTFVFALNLTYINVALASISNGADAVNLIGQLSSGSPIYTKKGSNNGPSNIGFGSISDSPSGVAIDKVNHRLFISDTENDRVMVYNLNTSDVLVDYTADFVLGQSSFTAANTTPSSTILSGPTALAYDSANTLLEPLQKDKPILTALCNMILAF